MRSPPPASVLPGYDQAVGVRDGRILRRLRRLGLRRLCAGGVSGSVPVLTVHSDPGNGDPRRYRQYLRCACRALIIGTFDRILATKLTGPLNSLAGRWRVGPGSWAILGGFFATHSLTSDRFLIFGLALVLVMGLRPGGLFPSKQRAAEMKGDDDNFEFDEYETNQTLRAARRKEA